DAPEQVHTMATHVVRDLFYEALPGIAKHSQVFGQPNHRACKTSGSKLMGPLHEGRLRTPIAAAVEEYEGQPKKEDLPGIPAEWAKRHPDDAQPRSPGVLLGRREATRSQE